MRMDERMLTELLECSVCLDQLDHSSKVLPCQHTFCRHCLKNIVRLGSKHELRCPECRLLVECKVDKLPPNIFLVRLLKGIKTSTPSTPGPVAGSSQSSQTPTADPEKRKLIQQQLVLLLHAHKCQRREQAQLNGEVRTCQLPHCRTMKNVLNHMSTCSAGKNCVVAHCASSRQIITHWKKCKRPDCPVCLPLRNNFNNRHAGGQNAQNTVNNLNPAPADMRRALEGLGLTTQPPGAQPGPLGAAAVRPQLPGALGAQGAQPVVSVAGPPGATQSNGQPSINLLNTPQQPQQQLGMTSPSPQPAPPTAASQTQFNSTAAAQGQMSAHQQLLSGIANSLANSATCNTPTPDGITAMTMTNRTVKDWHQSITQDLRNHLVHKLVQAIFPTPDPAALRDRRMNNLVQYARRVEGNMFEAANSREEYYHLIAGKMFKIQKELDEKRRQRQSQSTPGRGTAQPPEPGLVCRPATNGPLTSAVGQLPMQPGGLQQRHVAPGTRLFGGVPRQLNAGNIARGQSPLYQVSQCMRMDERMLTELLECSVCLDQLDHSSKVLPCQHTFCRRCLEVFVSAKHELRCPECRFFVECKVDELPPNILLVRLLEGIKTSTPSTPGPVGDSSQSSQTPTTDPVKLKLIQQQFEGGRGGPPVAKRPKISPPSLPNSESLETDLGSEQIMLGTPSGQQRSGSNELAAALSQGGQEDMTPLTSDLFQDFQHYLDNL